MQNKHIPQCCLECQTDPRDEKGDKDQEMDLMEESMEVWKIYKLLQRMKNK